MKKREDNCKYLFSQKLHNQVLTVAPFYLKMMVVVMMMMLMLRMMIIKRAEGRLKIFQLVLNYKIK